MEKKKYDLHKIGSAVFRAAGAVTVATEALGLGAFFYLATFTRYMADDFCEIVTLRRGSALSVAYQIYMFGNYRSSNRFSKLLLVSWSALLGRHDVQLLPIVMIILWLLGLTWIIYEVRKMIDLQQPVVVDLFIAISLVFFSILQAPNLLQTFFWRSSSIVHFLPLVLFSLLTGFILFQIRSARGNSPALWVSVAVFLVAFVVGGSGETPTILMVAVYALLLLFFWQRQGLERRPGLILFGSAFVGTFLALCALFLAPSNISRGKTSLLVLPLAIAKSLKFAFDFIWDTLLILPIPTLVVVILSGLLFFCLYIKPNQQALLPAQKKRVAMALVLVPLLSYLFIAVSFMPSAYAQSYPIERARFIGRFLMTAALFFEGALLGVWFAQLKTFLSYRHILFPVAGFFLLVVGFYPLRGGLWLWNNVESYRTWASSQDERQREIYRMAESGEQDPVVEWFPNRAGVKDIDSSAAHWMNKCVANYYGFNTIRSIPIGE